VNWKGEWETGRWEKYRSRGGTKWGEEEMPEEAKGEDGWRGCCFSDTAWCGVCAWYRLDT